MTNEHDLYESGYREGQSDNAANWELVISELPLWPDDQEVTPTAVVEFIAVRERAAAERALREAAAATRFATVGESYGDGWNAACAAIERRADAIRDTP